MSKHAIVSLSIGEEGEKISSLTYPCISAYASKIKADFIPIRERKYPEQHIFWEKLQIREILERYDRVLYLDADVIIRPDAPDIFEVVPVGYVAGFNEGGDNLRLMDNPRLNYEQMAMRACDIQGMPHVSWDRKFTLNAGVLLFDKAHRDLFQDPKVFTNTFLGEQNYLNIRIRQLGYKVFELPDTMCRTYYSPKPRLDAYLVHYAGAAHGVGYSEDIPKGKKLDYLISEDLRKWKDEPMNWEEVSTQLVLEKTWQKMTWMGITCWQTPADLLVMQEIIYETKPDLIIETGTKFGGSALFYSHMLRLSSLYDNAKVISVDIDQGAARNIMSVEAWAKAGVMIVEGDSKSQVTLSQVKEAARGYKRIMVALDSDHSKDHVLAELEAYGPMVTPEMYMVCFDTILEFVGGKPGLSHFISSNPAQAAREFLKRHPEFEVDRSREHQKISFSQRGFLKRKVNASL